MKKILLYILFLLLPFIAMAQGYGVVSVQMCWNTPSSVDSSITRYYLVSTRSKTPLLITTLNAAGDTVSVSGGTLSAGWCNCCGGGGGGGDVFAKNGLTKSGDTILLGGLLDRRTVFTGSQTMQLNGQDSLLLRVYAIMVGNLSNYWKLTGEDGVGGQVLTYDAAGDSSYWRTAVNLYTSDGTIVRNGALARTVTMDSMRIDWDNSAAQFNPLDPKNLKLFRLLARTGSDDDNAPHFITFVGTQGDSLFFSGLSDYFKLNSNVIFEIAAPQFDVRTDSTFLSLNSAGINYLSDNTVSPKGLQYLGDYRATLVDNSLVPKNYVDDKVSNGWLKPILEAGTNVSINSNAAFSIDNAPGSLSLRNRQTSGYKGQMLIGTDGQVRLFQYDSTNVSSWYGMRSQFGATTGTEIKGKDTSRVTITNALKLDSYKSASPLTLAALGKTPSNYIPEFGTDGTIGMKSLDSLKNGIISALPLGDVTISTGNDLIIESTDAVNENIINSSLIYMYNNNNDDLLNFEPGYLYLESGTENAFAEFEFKLPNKFIDLNVGTARLRLIETSGLVELYGSKYALPNQTPFSTLNGKSEIIFTGNGTGNVSSLNQKDYGSFSGTTDASGDVTVNCVMPDTAYVANVTITGTGTGVGRLQVHTKVPSSFKVRCYDAAGVVLGAGVAVTLDWTLVNN